MEYRLFILDLLSAASASLCDILNQAPANWRDIRAVLSNLVAEGFVSTSGHRNGPFCITDKGREYRLELREAAERKHAANEHSQGGKALFQKMVIAVLTRVLLLIGEHMPGLICWAMALFRNYFR